MKKAKCWVTWISDFYCGSRLFHPVVIGKLLKWLDTELLFTLLAGLPLANQYFHYRSLFCTKQVTVSSDALQEAGMRISETDVEISRHRVSVFLSTHTAYELIPESGKV